MSNEDARPCVACSARLGREGEVRAVSSRLITLAAGQLRHGLSEYADDWPKSTPKAVIRALEQDAERRRLLAIELRGLADKLTADRGTDARRAHHARVNPDGEDREGYRGEPDDIL